MAGLGGLTSVLIRNNHLGSLSYSCSCGSAEDGSLKLDPCFPPQSCKALIEVFGAEFCSYFPSLSGPSHLLLAASQAGLIIRNLGELTNSTC